MATATAKTPKITADLLSEYVAAKTQRLEIERSAKPFADKEKQLAGQIIEALEAAEVTTKKAGDFRATLITKPGLISWKDECVKRLATGELEEIQAAVGTRTSLDVQAA